MSLMLDEIAEQPAVLERTLASEREKYKKLGAFLRQKDIDLIVIVARGSSDNASLFGRYLLEVTTGIPVSLSAPSVYTIYNASLDLKRALVIGVSQSGEGADINMVLERARASGAYTLAITNEPGSTMSKLADETLLIHAGRERSVAATKTYTGQMLHFYLLANELAEKDRNCADSGIYRTRARSAAAGRGHCRAICVYGELRRRRTRDELRQRVRAGAQADGNVLCRRRTIFVC
jgi:glucosamine--fructose-6-phosphate aminotransferase (isomerizing)